MASDGPVLRYMIARSFPGLRTAGAEYTDERFGIVLARGSDDLRRAVNAALWKVQDGGEYARVHARWFGESDASAGPRAVATPSGGFDTQLVAGAWRLFVRGVWLTATLAATSLALGLPIGLALALARVPPRGWLACLPRPTSR